MLSGFARWEERYRNSSGATAPSELLLRFSNFLPRQGRALDLACGAGRNSVYLADRGLRVVGVERSWAALEKGRELARERRCAVQWNQADLERFWFPPQTFDIIACFYYRDPAIYPWLSAALRPGGLLFYETFTWEQFGSPGRPRNPAHLLRPGELLQAIGDWEVLFYRETWGDRAVAALVARKSGLAARRA